MLLRGTGTNISGGGALDNDKVEYNKAGSGGGGPASMIDNKDN
jgi:hypothetical protein